MDTIQHIYTVRYDGENYIFYCKKDANVFASYVGDYLNPSYVRDGYNDNVKIKVERHEYIPPKDVVRSIFNEKGAYNDSYFRYLFYFENLKICEEVVQNICRYRLEYQKTPLLYRGYKFKWNDLTDDNFKVEFDCIIVDIHMEEFIKENCRLSVAQKRAEKFKEECLQGEHSDENR